MIQFHGSPAILANVIDITKQKYSEQILEKQRTRFSQVVGSLGYGVAIVDEEEKLRFINDAGVKIAGVARKDLLGKK